MCSYDLNVHGSYKPLDLILLSAVSRERKKNKSTKREYPAFFLSLEVESRNPFLSTLIWRREREGERERNQSRKKKGRRRICKQNGRRRICKHSHHLPSFPLPPSPSLGFFLSAIQVSIFWFQKQCFPFSSKLFMWNNKFLSGFEIRGFMAFGLGFPLQFWVNLGI